MEKKVRICFVANFHKTYVFHEIGTRLSREGADIFWIVTKLDQFHFLKKHYPVQNVLYINRAFAEKSAEPVADLRLNELVYGDRVFKYHMSEGLSFLTNIQKPIFDFVKEHKIRFIISEPTWAHELLIRRIVTTFPELNCLFLNCSLVRIPNKRFAFFTDESENDILEFDEPYERGKIIEIEKPFYLQINDKIVKSSSSVKGRINRLKRFITGENIEKNDPNVITHTPTRFKLSSLEELNRISYRRLTTLEFSDVEKLDYVFVGFHKQPESSIDVFGRYHEDQALNIINLWRLLPGGWKVVLKEHTNAIGDRSLRFYKKLLEYPGILIVNETTDSKKLIANSRLVATVSGTIAYEAALMKKPAITFAPVFFNKINYCRHMPLHELVKYENLKAIVDELEAQPDNREEYSAYVMKNSFDGFVTDHVTLPEVLDEENMRKVCAGFKKLFARYS